MDPVSLGIMAAVGMGAAAAGGVVGAAGSEFAGGATASQQRYQAAVADMNAQVAKQDAAYAEAAGEVRAQQIGMRGRAQVAATEAGFGASNVAGASRARVLGSETEITQFEEASTRWDAARQAYGFGVRAAGETAQAGAYRAGAKTALVAGDIGATSSILGGVGNVSSKWMQGQQAGIFGSSSDGGVNPDSAYGRQVYGSSIYT